MNCSLEQAQSEPDILGYDRKNDALIEMLIEEVRGMRRELKEHQEAENTDLKQIKKAFDTAKSVVWFIKWSVSIVTALALALVFLKEHLTIGIK